MHSLWIGEEGSEFVVNLRYRWWIESEFVKSLRTPFQFSKNIVNSKWIGETDCKLEVNTQKKIVNLKWIGEINSELKVNSQWR